MNKVWCDTRQSCDTHLTCQHKAPHTDHVGCTTERIPCQRVNVLVRCEPCPDPSAPITGLEQHIANIIVDTGTTTEQKVSMILELIST